MEYKSEQMHMAWCSSGSIDNEEVSWTRSKGEMLQEQISDMNQTKTRKNNEQLDKINNIWLIEVKTWYNKL